ncbi:transposase family protein [Chloroflexus sp.]|uniref:transposase family protein n=1 Tax=Chloroflexus sp. TaxID=1904827 RepID=UPI00404AA347
MDYGTLQPWQEINENGVICDVSSLFASLDTIRDSRKARGKRYHLTTLLLIICLAKLCGQDSPVEISDWAKNHTEVLVQLLNLK